MVAKTGDNSVGSIGVVIKNIQFRGSERVRTTAIDGIVTRSNHIFGRAAGLMSRWKMPSECAASSPSAI